MTLVRVLCEGQTEREFVQHVLAPHLLNGGFGLVEVTPVVVMTRRSGGNRAARGGGSWSNLYADLRRHMHDTRPNLHLSTMIDLYALPPDFPSRDQLLAERDTLRRAEAMERAMAEVVDDHRFIPYVQRHEFEALVLAGLEQLEAVESTSAARAGIARLRADIRGRCPEDINGDNPPGRRLEAAIPGYQKAIHGPLVTGAVGLPTLRERCPRFDAWVKRLESLGEVAT